MSSPKITKMPLSALQPTRIGSCSLANGLPMTEIHEKHHAWVPCRCRVIRLNFDQHRNARGHGMLQVTWRMIAASLFGIIEFSKKVSEKSAPQSLCTEIICSFHDGICLVAKVKQYK
jgi:hypothetical protein